MTSQQLACYAYAAIGYTVGILTALLAVLIAKLCQADGFDSRLSGLERVVDKLNEEPDRSDHIAELEYVIASVKQDQAVVESKVDQTIDHVTQLVECVGDIAEILKADKIKIDYLGKDTAELWGECSDLWSRVEPIEDASADMSAVDCPSNCPCRDEDTVDYAEMPGSQKQFDELYDRPRTNRQLGFDFSEIRL